MRQIKEKEAYEKICKAFKAQPTGATIADVVSKTSLPLTTVRSLAPVVADEFSGRLQVTEGGEILYSFPRGFTSKYRGFKARFFKIMGSLGKVLKIAGMTLFKIWIMVMLIGYFVIFIALALLSTLAVTVAASSGSKNSSSRSSGGIINALFGVIIRIWFYSELTKSLDGQRQTRPKAKGKPLYKSIFSFVFGEGAAEKEGVLSETELHSIIAFIQTNKGIISLPEFMILTGLDPQQADKSISAFCADYSGSPEATEEGTIIYRFEDLMNTRQNVQASTRPHLKALRDFSSNKKSMNIWFNVINGVNAAFGAYFLLSPLNSLIHAITFSLFSQFIAPTASFAFISIGLGFVPLVFSALFWLIPIIRSFMLKRDNTRIKLSNFRSLAYNQIWNRPRTVSAQELVFSGQACTPKHLEKAQEQVIKELGSYTIPDVSIENGRTVYSFPGLEQEALALQESRNTTIIGSLGAIVFDTDENL